LASTTRRPALDQVAVSLPRPRWAGGHNHGRPGSPARRPLVARATRQRRG
jgi:hypothetical protein